MIYHNQNEQVIIRSMIKTDIECFVNGFAEQSWHKPVELFTTYYNEQEQNKRSVIVAEMNKKVAGYVTLLPNTNIGPFAIKDIPEIVDLNVLIAYQKNGIGNKMMDVAENLAREKSSFVSLSVGLHYGYGTAQRMYVKRGYLPDGSGVWYKGKQLEQYTDCFNDDDLTLYFLKQLQPKQINK
ncbi:GNAT family N-acetyltransferase [Bacillus sp. JCM 19041]|uniref:GNAT family N-acetyltransferase n=1 Tax=Bacillus sp. JCM 19041 TaxID=1460637 RepID=UPI0006CFBCD1